MSRSTMLGAAALAALISSPIATAVGQDGITVTGPRAKIFNEPGSMLTVTKMSGGTVVNYSDLDLRTTAGRNILWDRVRYAARKTCDRLDKINWDGVPLTGADTCMINAMADARPQIYQAIAVYGG